MIPTRGVAVGFWIAATRATMVTSPDTDWYVEWNSSAAPAMSVPDPRTVNVGLVKDALPSAATAPTSASSQGGGGGEELTVTPIGAEAVVALMLSVATTVNR